MAEPIPIDGPTYDDDTYDDDDVDDGVAGKEVTKTNKTRGLDHLTYAGDDEEDEDDAKELAEMFAKVQTIQRAEGMEVAPVKVKPPPSRGQAYDQLEVAIPERNTSKRESQAAPRPSTSTSSSLRSRSSSPAGSAVATNRSPDGITTVSRRALASGSMDVLSGVKKPMLFQDRLLQTVKQQPQTLERLTQKVVAIAPATIAKRVESLSEPKKNYTGRKFANDDDAKNCRFQSKKKTTKGGGRDTYDDDDASGHDRTSGFITRMEAAERNKQKKLELTRGENEYLANLNKKVCPKCDVAQSYTEYRDKKKKCQMCGSEFRVPQAWGDIGTEFISRISEDSRQRGERKEQIRAHVTHIESASGRVAKSATQQFYEKTLQQRDDHKTFLDRNYTSSPMRSTAVSMSSSDAKTKQAQAQLQKQLQAQRAKLVAAAQPPIY